MNHKKPSAIQGRVVAGNVRVTRSQSMSIGSAAGHVLSDVPPSPIQHVQTTNQPTRLTRSKTVVSAATKPPVPRQASLSTAAQATRLPPVCKSTSSSSVWASVQNVGLGCLSVHESSSDDSHVTGRINHTDNDSNNNQDQNAKLSANHNLQLLFPKHIPGWEYQTESLIELCGSMRAKARASWIVKGPSASAHIHPEQHRYTLMLWILQLENHFGLRPETLHRCVHLIDQSAHRMTVDLKKYQLLGTVALWVASKLEERYVMELSELLELTADSYRQEEALEMEKRLIRVFNFHLQPPDVLFFLRPAIYFLQQSTANESALTTSRVLYCVDLWCTQSGYASTLPQRTAAAAIALVMHVDHGTWPPELECILGYGSAEPVHDLVCHMAALITHQNMPSDTEKPVQAKYSRERHGRVATSEWVERKEMYELADCNSWPVLVCKCVHCALLTPP